MISKQAVEEQLKRIGCNFKFWGRAEVNELGRILLEDEVIAECTNGEYANGFALLVATNHRILLVDKKPMLYLTVEDLRYDMITEFNYSHRMMNATIRLYTANKTLIFTSWNQHRLRRLLEYSQQRVLEMRQQQHMAQQFQAAAAAQYAQMHAANHYQFTPQTQPSYAPNLAPQVAAAVQPSPSAEYPQYQQPDAATSIVVPASQMQTAEALDPAAAPQTVVATNDQHYTMGAMVSRFSAKRTALGTYTRSKLPSFRRHQDQQEQRQQDQVNLQATSGEIFPQGYTAGRPVTDFGLPYEY